MGLGYFSLIPSYSVKIERHRLQRVFRVRTLYNKNSKREPIAYGKIILKKLRGEINKMEKTDKYVELEKQEEKALELFTTGLNSIEIKLFLKYLSAKHSLEQEKMKLIVEA